MKLTQAIIRKGTTIEQVVEVLNSKYSVVSVAAPTPTIMFISIKDREDLRVIAVSFSNHCQKEYGIEGVYLDINYWGNSVEILKYLCGIFGGYINEDSTDVNFLPINYHLFTQGVDFSHLDKLRHHLISHIPMDKVPAVMNCLDQYLRETNQLV